MKTINFITIGLLSIFLFACSEKENTTENVASLENGIEVIDFYGTHRCITCKAIEKNTKYTLDTYFKKEQEEGKIVLRVLNVDEEANYAIAEKFEATGTALFLNIIKDGKEEHINLTDFAFQKGKDQDAFSAGLKEEISKHLD